MFFVGMKYLKRTKAQHVDDELIRGVTCVNGQGCQTPLCPPAFGNSPALPGCCQKLLPQVAAPRRLRTPEKVLLKNALCYTELHRYIFIATT